MALSPQPWNCLSVPILSPRAVHVCSPSSSGSSEDLGLRGRRDAGLRAQIFSCPRVQLLNQKLVLTGPVWPRDGFALACVVVF